MLRGRSQCFQSAVLLIGVLLVALNLRPALTVISPLAERMRLDGLSRELIGSLTTIPLILFGVVGLWAGWIGVRIGLTRALGLGLLLLGLGCLFRSAPDLSAHFWRFGGTILIGAGIALGNVLLPGLVKDRYPDRIGLMTGLYSTGMNLGAAAGFALAVPLADRLPGGWNSALGAWGLFALLGLLLWSPQLRTRPEERPAGKPLRGVLILARRRRSWELAVFMGLQSTLFYSSVAWLPTVLQFRGMSEAGAAGWVTGMQITGCAASLVAPTLAARRDSQAWWVAGCCLLTALNIGGILILPPAWTGWAVIGLGAGVNACFGIALLLIAVRSRDSATAASLSSLSQAAGYLLAAPGPWLVGWMSETAGGWTLAFGFIAALSVLTAIVGAYAGRSGELALEP